MAMHTRAIIEAGGWSKKGTGKTMGEGKLKGDSRRGTMPGSVRSSSSRPGLSSRKAEERKGSKSVNLVGVAEGSEAHVSEMHLQNIQSSCDEEEKWIFRDEACAIAHRDTRSGLMEILADCGAELRVCPLWCGTEPFRRPDGGDAEHPRGRKTSLTALWQQDGPRLHRHRQVLAHWKSQ